MYKVCQPTLLSILSQPLQLTHLILLCQENLLLEYESLKLNLDEEESQEMSGPALWHSCTRECRCTE